ncbi:helix-turn-helix domain-containing protein [Streptosporangium subroseum]|uniref:helix-turn-helix domain-containing protein n=1 Tax=Streptosporangium subroseum TaxID=106412 RepID=UPI00308BD454|nr:helix-turn-helix domain-containing protein [Streptosporangium subroseum]
MPNERLRTTIHESGYTEQSLARELALDPKSIQRWITRDITPRRASAYRAAKLLDVSPVWLWPDIEISRETSSQSEQVSLYPHRADAPRHLWMDLLSGASKDIWLFANASLFLPEENPDSIALIRNKAESGVTIRILMGDPDSPEMALRGVEEQLYDAIPARIRMALTYYSPLVGLPGIHFRLHRTSLYNSIFRYDNEMLINQHIFGSYGYIAPLLHLRRVEGSDFFDTYIRSFERVWNVSQPVEESNFWKQRVALLSGDVRDSASSTL